MKKPSFYFLATILAVGLAACGNDASDCSLVGQWKVKSADVKSEKLDSTILMMSKEMMMQSTYLFTADSVNISTGGPAGMFSGPYSIDAVNELLVFKDVLNNNGNPYMDNMKISNCSGSEVTLLARSPSDTTKAALTTSTIVLEKVK